MITVDQVDFELIKSLYLSFDEAMKAAKEKEAILQRGLALIAKDKGISMADYTFNFGSRSFEPKPPEVSTEVKV